MKHQKSSIIYLIIVAILFLAFVVVFDTFPRTKISQLEKRELATFPEFSWESLANGTFTSKVSSWFSDSEPFRDELMTLSMQIKDLIGIAPTEDNIKFHAPEPTAKADPPKKEEKKKTEEPDDSADDNSETDENTMEENAKIANAGIIVIGKDQNVRALMAYGGEATGCTGYAEVANYYKQTFPQANVYCMVIPTSIAYYCPEKVKKHTKPQLPTIRNVIAHLDPEVKPVNVYFTLKRHKDEDIYLRTDHHWSPLGGYYAAQTFAKVAGVPFKDLKHYEQHVVHGYVGSMYGYSKDISVKNAPEDFVYYIPKDVEYNTTYIVYTINKNYQVTGESKPAQGPFFYKYKDGNGGAYCTMMGGDTKITQVRTSTQNGRRLMILKDSFGNMLPGYLFYSFEEIHVIDGRYFTKDMVSYVNENKITDILFANNIFSAYSNSTCNKYRKFINQQWSKSPEKSEEPKADETVEKSEKHEESKISESSKISENSEPTDSSATSESF